MTRSEQIRRIHERIERLKKVPQSVAAEEDRAYLEIELMKLQAERDIAVACRWKLFMDAYKKTGQMVAIRPGCPERRGAPVRTAYPVECFWNVKYEAKHLAEWSVD